MAVASIICDAEKLSIRDKLILTGLYLSKYDLAGLDALGLDSFLEAFNVIGYALGSKPASIKNYRDEFDPIFPNQRKGWHKRRTRDYCLAILKQYETYDFNLFTGLVRSFFGDTMLGGSSFPVEFQDQENSSFSQRLITGLAAEHYFESIQPKVPEFAGRTLVNTTRFGCGYDFRLNAELNDTSFFAVEVKGLKEKAGSVLMTPKEHYMASMLEDRFFLFIVKNFRESPFHEIYCNPLSSTLQFSKFEKTVIQTSWSTSV